MLLTKTTPLLLQLPPLLEGEEQEQELEARTPVPRPLPLPF
jgi:hypothetical protein